MKVFDIDEEEKNRSRVDNVTQPMEVRAKVSAGLHVVGTAFLRQNSRPQRTYSPAATCGVQSPC